ncbi:MAG: CRISPR-associated endonuclease Cas2 [Verrucomicrobiales bacterium]|nr:CRISPR-associated endonuclease Cas2 [Verrucomicrobiales bacterium]
MRHSFIVTYDIRNEKRLRKVFRTCRDFGIHLQYSVFECDLNPSDKIRMETRLKEIIHHTEDQVLFIDLGPASHRAERSITALGQTYVKFDPPCFIA